MREVRFTCIRIDRRTTSSVHPPSPCPLPEGEGSKDGFTLRLVPAQDATPAQHRALSAAASLLGPPAGIVLATSLVFLLTTPVAHAAQPGSAAPAVVVAEEDNSEQPAPVAVPVAIDAEEEFIIEEEGPGSAWKARPIEPRPAGEELAFVRHTSEVFDDPDDPLTLELKYYFVLGDQPLEPAAGSSAARRGTASSEGAASSEDGASPNDAGPRRFELAAGGFADGLARHFPLDLDDTSRAGGVEVCWLDYHARSGPTRAVLLCPGDEEHPALLVVARAERRGEVWHLTRQLAVRELPAAEVPAKEGSATDGSASRLDCWDRSPALGAAGMFLGRVIAVLKEVDGRQVVDFYGESLHTDSDCRVLLGPIAASHAASVGLIRFIEVPILHSSGEVRSITVLALSHQDDAGQRRTIAFDYPLCMPPLMAQMRERAQQEGGSTGISEADLRRLVGEALLDEFELRLVRAVYR